MRCGGGKERQSSRPPKQHCRTRLAELGRMLNSLARNKTRVGIIIACSDVFPSVYLPKLYLVINRSRIHTHTQAQTHKLTHLSHFFPSRALLLSFQFRLHLSELFLLSPSPPFSAGHLGPSLLSSAAIVPASRFCFVTTLLSLPLVFLLPLLHLFLLVLWTNPVLNVVRAWRRGYSVL